MHEVSRQDHKSCTKEHAVSPHNLAGEIKKKQTNINTYNNTKWNKKVVETENAASGNRGDCEVWESRKDSDRAMKNQKDPKGQREGGGASQWGHAFQCWCEIILAKAEDLRR